MADPGRAVEVHAAVAVSGQTDSAKHEVDGHVARKPEALVAQIDRTREELARTIDTIAERVSPGHNARLLRERVTEQMTRPEVQLAAAAVGLAVVGLAILRVWGRRRRS